MRKFIIVLKIKSLATGQAYMADYWEKYDDEPSVAEIVRVKNLYQETVATRENKNVEYAKAICVYV